MQVLFWFSELEARHVLCRGRADLLQPGNATTLPSFFIRQLRGRYVAPYFIFQDSDGTLTSPHPSVSMFCVLKCLSKYGEFSRSDEGVKEI